MARDPRTLLFVGIKDSAIALDIKTGAEIWRTKLKRSDFVTIMWDGQSLVAANSGEVFGLDWETGVVQWHNPLKGLGWGPVSLASSRAPTTAAPDTAILAKKKRDQQTATTAAAT